MLGLPRGGVPVAAAVASAVGAPLDVFVVRKLGVPGREELAMGAVATGGARVVNREVIDALAIPDDVLAAVAAAEERELARREAAYRGERRPPDLADRPVILVDDGLATGATMRAALRAVGQAGSGPVTVAVPTAPAATLAALRAEADEVVWAASPEPFLAVGASYRDFAPTTDDEVRKLLSRT
ncbi:MAG: phosphoribosyltransferase [Actinomycetota bacterium]|nr:phosphoribosyltransferase [Actinomycetota bacterium]